MNLLVDALIGMPGSVMVGVFLWLYLPRGVVLSRTESGELPDTWTLTNTSALSIQLLDVLATGSVAEFEASRSVTLAGLNGLTFGFPHNEIWFDDWSNDPGVGWDQVVMEPGDDMVLNVPANSDVVVVYRRAGRSGWLERRRVTVHGTV